MSEPTREELALALADLVAPETLDQARLREGIRAGRAVLSRCGGGGTMPIDRCLLVVGCLIQAVAIVDRDRADRWRLFDRRSRLVKLAVEYGERPGVKASEVERVLDMPFSQVLGIPR